MVKLKWILGLFVVFGIAASAFAANENAADPWGDSNKIKLGVTIQSGDSISAWEGAGRNDVTNNATSFFTPDTEMTAVGDGTYQIKTWLVPNSVYNYIFRAKLAQSIAGLSAGSELTEPVPNGTQTDDGGNASTTDPGFFISSNSTVYVDPNSGSVSFASIGGDARRKIVMPDIDPGTTVYVFNNFGSIPRGVANYSAVPGANYVDFAWRGGLGTWGAGSGSADCFGGSYALYLSTGVSSGPYTLQTTFAGITTSYRLTGLTQGSSYYFIFVASDAYKGVTRSSYTAVKAMWANLARPINTSAGSASYSADEYNHNDKSAKPNFPAPVYFKVENIDEEYVKEHGNVVYMTPWNEDGRAYFEKIPGTFMTVYIPKQGS